MSRNLLLMSSSRTPLDQRWLGHSESSIQRFLRVQGVGKVTFVPFAGAMIAHDEYAAMARERFHEMGFALDTLNESDAICKINTAEAIVVGGGNTPKLAETIHRLPGLAELIRSRVLEQNVPYMGWSAGAGLACPTIQTTNDWFIADPTTVTLEGLHLFPININPHYRDPVVISDELRKEVAALLAELYAKIPALKDELENKGETRIDRIHEFMNANGKPVLGMREGAILRVNDTAATLEGTAGVKLFRPDKEPQSYDPGARMDFLLRGS